MERPPGQTANLPRQFTPFIGRDQELAEIIKLLADPACALLTLLGPGGAGKTRLAIEAAGRMAAAFKDGIYFVPLQAVESTALLLSAITDAINLSLHGQETPRVQLLDYLRDKEMLLLLDNFEQLLTGSSIDLILDIFEVAPTVKLLVTSRELLNLQQEWLFTVSGLPVPADDRSNDDLDLYGAVRLFSERAGRVRRDFSSAKTRTEVIRICRLVEGMPLAIELAASWTRTMECAQIAAEIQRNIDFLSSTLRDLPDRQRSMRAVFDQSWQLLTRQERQVFQRLSVFRGTFQRQAAKKVAGASLSTLSALVDKSLLRPEAGGRYQIHELLHQYAAEQLVHSPEDVARVYDLHCTYYTNFLADRADEILRGRQREVVAEIKDELENIRAAWQWAIEVANVEAVLKMAVGLDSFYQYQSRFEEGLNGMAQATRRLESLEKTERHELALAELLVYQGWYHIRLGQFDEAQFLFERSQAIYSDRQISPPSGPGTNPLAGLAILAVIRGEYQAGVTLAEQARQAHEARADAHNLAVAHYALTSAYLALGEYETARQHAKQAVELLQAVNDRWFMAYCLNEWGNVARAMGEYPEARQHYQASYTIRQEFDDPEGMAVALNHLGRVATLEKNYVEAKRLYQQSLSIYRDINDRGGLATSLGGLGVAACGEGDHDLARPYFQRALKIATEMQFVPLILSIMAELAELHARTGRPVLAVELLALVSRHPASDRETKDKAEACLNELQGKLLPETFAAAAERGRQSNLTPVVEAIQLELAATGEAVEPETHPGQVTPATSVERANAELVEPLTDRELEVLQLIAQGLTNQQIADELIISVGTAKWYTGQIYGKLAVSNRTQAVARARELNILG